MSKIPSLPVRDTMVFAPVYGLFREGDIVMLAENYWKLDASWRKGLEGGHAYRVLKAREYCIDLCRVVDVVVRDIDTGSIFLVENAQGLNPVSPAFRFR